MSPESTEPRRPEAAGAQVLSQLADEHLQRWQLAQGERSVCRVDTADADSRTLKTLEGATHGLKEALRLCTRGTHQPLLAVDETLAKWQAQRNPARGSQWSAYVAGGVDALLHAHTELSSGSGQR